MGLHLPTQLQTWITWGNSLKPVNVLMATGVIKTGTLATTFHKPAEGKSSYVRFVYVPLTLFNHIRWKVPGSMGADSVNIWYTRFNNQQKKDWIKNLTDILDQENQSFEVNKYEHPNVTLTTTFHKSVGEENLYVWFGYRPQKICNHTWRKVPGSMNNYTISANKQVNNQWHKDDN